MKKLSGQGVLLHASAAFLALVSVVISSMINPLYGQVDNYSIAIVLNRLWDRNAYVHYLHPWLCAFLAELSDVLPHADVFSLFLHALQFLILYALTSLLLKSAEITRRKKCFGCLFIVSVYFFMHIFSANYTIIACLCAVTGGIILLSGLSKPSPLRTIAGLMFLCAGIMLRSKGAFLALPYIFLELFIEVLQNRHNRPFMKRAAAALSLILLCAGVLLATKAITDSSEPYRASVHYSRLQSAAMDYPHMPYAAIEDRLEGISESEYTAATRWITLDTETLNADLFRAIKDAHRGTTILDTDGISLVQLFKRLALYLYRNIQWTIFAGAALVLIVFRLAFHSRLRAIFAFMLIAGSAAIILYFALIGRCNDRVWVPVVICMLVYGILPVIRMEKCSHAFYAGVSLIMLASLACTMYLSSVHSPAHALNARKDNQNTICVENPADDTLYIWSNWHEDVSKKFAGAGKLPSKEFLAHNLPAGEWFYEQPYFKNHLERIGAVNPARALFERENTYLVCKDFPRLYAELFQDLYPEYNILPSFPVQEDNSPLTAYHFEKKIAATPVS